MRALLAFLMLLLATPSIGQFTVPKGMDPARFPPIPPLTIYEEVLVFRAEVERQIEEVGDGVLDAGAMTALADTLIAKWEYYGEYMDRQHGDFYLMSREEPYWLITTDEAADTLTDRLGLALKKYVVANPGEKIGMIRADWEMSVQDIGVPKNRIYGFQFVELARRGAEVRRQLESKYPDQLPEVYDAYLRFLWDLIQFYTQQHTSWYDRYKMEVSKEDWIVHRMRSICEERDWTLAMSFTAIGVDSTNMDPMNDKFMHRLVIVNAACPETIDFVVPLRHYRLMERELNSLSDEERRAVMEGHQKELIERGQREIGGER